MCDYCKEHGRISKIIMDNHQLYLNKDGKNYLKAELVTNHIDESFIRIESVINSKMNSGIFNINFCPMCGENLNKGENNA